MLLKAKRRPRVAWLALMSLTLTLFWMLYQSGGIYPSSRSIALGVIALTAIFFLLDKTAKSAPVLGKTVRRSFFVLCGCACLQVIPLPLAAVRWLSPQRAALTEMVQDHLGGSTWSPLSVFPLMSVLELTTAAGAVLVFVLILRLASSVGRWAAAAPLLAAALGEAMLGLKQAADPSGPATALGTYLNRNHLAGFLEIIFPLCIAGAWTVFKTANLSFRQRIVFSAALLASALVMIDAILHTYSRMGWLVSLIDIFVLMCLMSWNYIRSSTLKPWTIVALLAAVAAIAMVVAPARLQNRLVNNSEIDRESTELRIGFWRDSLPMIRDYALTGCGLGAFKAVYPHYQTVGLTYRIEYAHNDFVQAAVELGLPGIFALVVLLGALLLQAKRSIWKENDQEVDWLGMACMTAIFGMLLHSLVDFNLHIPANLIMLSWIAGIALSNCRQQKFLIPLQVR